MIFLHRNQYSSLCNSEYDAFIPVHFSSVDENEVALRAFDIHGLLLVLEGDVLSEVGPAEERVAAEVADEVFGHRQAHLVPLVHLLMPAWM